MTNDCKTCPVSTGTHKPAEAVHQIDEPQAEALRLAAELVEPIDGFQEPTMWEAAAAAELRRLHARIAELESQLDAIGAGGVEPLRKQAAAPQEEAIAEIVSASHDQAEFGERAINFLRDFQHLEYGTKLYPAAQAVHQIAEPAAPVGKPIKDAIDALVMAAFTEGGCSEHRMSEARIQTELRKKELCTLIAATQPAAQGMDAGKLLAEKHTGMKVDYRGLLGQVQREIERSAPGHAEMLRQLQGHLQELGQRWYAGDTAVVDELLQLYCVERQARADLAAQAKQGGADHG